MTQTKIIIIINYNIQLRNFIFNQNPYNISLKHNYDKHAHVTTS